MPLLHRKPFIRQKPPADLRPDEEVFLCKITHEIFRTYDEFFERTILCNSLVWSCALTGRAGLTYLEAVESERRARQSLESFPQSLVVPLLHLAALSQCCRLTELCEDVYAFVKDRFFPGEVVDVSGCNGARYVCEILQAHLPDSSVSRAPDVNGHGKMADDDTIVISDSDDEHSAFQSSTVQVNGRKKSLSPSVFKYTVRMMKNKHSEPFTVRANQISRKKSALSRERLKLLFKQHCEPQNGIVALKPSSMAKYQLSKQTFSQFFPDEPPLFSFSPSSKCGRRDSPGQASSSLLKAAEEKLKLLQQREEMVAAVQDKARLKKEKEEVQEARRREREDKERLREEQRRRFEEEKQRRREEKERRKLEKDREREKLKEEKKKYAEQLKLWSKPREDMECEDLKELPRPIPVKTRLPAELFGDALMVLEFLQAFGEAFDLKDEFPDGVSLEVLEEALVGSDPEGPLCELLFFFLTAIFQALDEEQEEVATDQVEGQTHLLSLVRLRKEEKMREQEQRMRAKEEKMKEQELKGRLQTNGDSCTEHHTEHEEEQSSKMMTAKGDQKEQQQQTVSDLKPRTSLTAEELEREQEKVRELQERIQKAAACTCLLPLGRDRLYRRYWLFPSASALFVEADHFGLTEDMLQPSPKPEQDTSSTKVEKGEEMAKDKAASTGPPINQSNQWSFYSSLEEVDHLIEALNPRGHRESSLKEALLQERERLQHLLKSCDRNKYEHTEDQESSQALPECTAAAESMMEVRLRELLLDIEDRIHQGTLGTLKVMDRQVWRLALEAGNYELLASDGRENTGMNGRVEAMEVDSAHLRARDRLQEVKSDSSAAYGSSGSGTPQVVSNSVRILAQALTNIEQGIERRFLKAPLADEDSKKDHKMKNKKKKDEDQASDDGSDCGRVSKTVLERWRESLQSCSSLSQSVPEGEWFCPDCRPKQRSNRLPSRQRSSIDEEEERDYDDEEEEEEESEEEEEEESEEESEEEEEEEVVANPKKRQTALPKGKSQQATPRNSITTSGKNTSASKHSPGASSSSSNRRSSGRNQGVHELSACEQLTVELVRHEDSWPFMKLVSRTQVPDYYDIIKKPIALNTIREKVNNCEYQTAGEYVSDVELMFSNCLQYNPRHTNEAKAGHRLQRFFHAELSRLGLLEHGSALPSKRSRH
ncbi:bromodomain adjacent to zinc finger domain protein 1A [Neolamprologus brichardi]|uniref:bromodomain adjacent to zinc finger domain protein 1A n=1 Tax=Neolamprologus brichardi TaxID=32507 RepID=UPI0003EC104B|nr:bromodomain adjacent to zinc finger domain protein 1A [Neolamprologus brichardi]